MASPKQIKFADTQDDTNNINATFSELASQQINLSRMSLAGPKPCTPNVRIVKLEAFNNGADKIRKSIMKQREESEN
jgi:hypothetical protein